MSCVPGTLGGSSGKVQCPVGASLHMGGWGLWRCCVATARRDKELASCFARETNGKTPRIGRFARAARRAPGPRGQGASVMRSVRAGVPRLPARLTIWALFWETAQDPVSGPVPDWGTGAAQLPDVRPSFPRIAPASAAQRSCSSALVPWRRPIARSPSNFSEVCEPKEAATRGHQ